MDFLELMKLESHGSDTWVGVGPKYPWGGLYGGQIVAQGLRAAAHSVDPKLTVHSLHAYFIRRGDHEAPVRYEVDRVRDGKSFATRSVVARQSAGAILNMITSFQLPEAAAELQTIKAPQLPGPEEGREATWNTLFDRHSVRRRHLDPNDPHACAWFRIKDELPDDPLIHACALAYISDDLPIEAVRARHPKHTRERTTKFWSASLDHAIWFHDTLKADAYHLYDFGCHALRGGRGLAIGHVFDTEGRHVATVNQEALIRELKKD